MNHDSSHTIAEQNDTFRSQAKKSDARSPLQGKFSMTLRVAAMEEESLKRLILLVRDFDNFTPENDPHGEHDFGAIEFEGETYFWKIDYYDLEYEFGSEDPANPDITRRVLMLMLASEY